MDKNTLELMLLALRARNIEQKRKVLPYLEKAKQELDNTIDIWKAETKPSASFVQSSVDLQTSQPRQPHLKA